MTGGAGGGVAQEDDSGCDLLVAGVGRSADDETHGPSQRPGLGGEGSEISSGPAQLGDVGVTGAQQAAIPPSESQTGSAHAAEVDHYRTGAGLQVRTSHEWSGTHRGPLRAKYTTVVPSVMVPPPGRIAERISTT